MPAHGRPNRLDHIDCVHNNIASIVTCHLKGPKQMASTSLQQYTDSDDQANFGNQGEYLWKAKI